jgi:hypothetical protein
VEDQLATLHDGGMLYPIGINRFASQRQRLNQRTGALQRKLSDVHEAGFVGKNVYESFGMAILKQGERTVCPSVQ